MAAGISGAVSQPGVGASLREGAREEGPGCSPTASGAAGPCLAVGRPGKVRRRDARSGPALSYNSLESVSGQHSWPVPLAWLGPVGEGTQEARPLRSRVAGRTPLRWPRQPPGSLPCSQGPDHIEAPRGLRGPPGHGRDQGLAHGCQAGAHRVKMQRGLCPACGFRDRVPGVSPKLALKKGKQFSEQTKAWAPVGQPW